MRLSVFNNILRRIWHLPCNCHTRILHLTARLPSLFNVIISRAASLLSSALSCSSLIFRKVFGDSSLLAYTHTGYNAMSGDLHAKRYYQEDGLCATVIRHLRVLGPSRTMTLMGWLILFVLISACLFSYLCKLAPLVVGSTIIIIIRRRRRRRRRLSCKFLRQSKWILVTLEEIRMQHTTKHCSSFNITVIYYM